MDDQYYPTQTIITDGAIIHIRRPILTDEERAKRMKAIHDAACKVVIANERLRRQREQEAVRQAAKGTV